MTRQSRREKAANQTKLDIFAVTVDCGPGGHFSTAVETKSESVAKKTARARARKHCADFGFEFGAPSGSMRFVSIQKVAP